MTIKEQLVGLCAGLRGVVRGKEITAPRQPPQHAHWTKPTLHTEQLTRRNDFGAPSEPSMTSAETLSEASHWLRRNALLMPPQLNQLTRPKRALKPRAESQLDSRNRSERPRETEPNSLANRKRTLKPRTEPIASAKCALKAPNWTNWLRETRFKSPELNHWLAKRALKPSIDSRNALWSLELNQLTRRNALWSPELNQMIVLCALKSRNEANDLRSALWSPELNQMICAMRSEVPNLIKWFALWSPELNQMICALLNQIDSRNALWRAPFWTKWLAKRALNPRSESNYSRNALWRAPVWIKWLAKHALNPRSEPNDSRNALWIPVLNQITRETRFEEPRSEPNDSRNALWIPVLNQMTRETRFDAPFWTKLIYKCKFYFYIYYICMKMYAYVGI